jgi:hypothetical protein
MAVHWTYRDVGDPEVDLEQGDILLPSDGLVSLFREVHPHFTQDKYLGFMVATQTCDLVRRKNESKAGYISLAAIRPLSKMMPKLLAHVISPVASGKFPQSGCEEAKRLLERIFNQNEQSIGLFFLYPDADIGIGEEAVAMLRVTVSVKREHYSTLTKTRVGRLKEDFQAKLGWLLGNLYNRPATPDWTDSMGGKEKIDSLVKSFSQPNASSPLGFSWVDDVLISEAKRKGVSIETATDEDLELLRPSPSLDRALEEIQAQVLKVLPALDREALTKVCNRLRNSGKFKKLLVS